MNRASRHCIATLGLTLLTVAGCAAPPSAVSFRVVVVGDDPFLGADSIDLRIVRADGSLLLDDRIDPSERSVALGPLPFATEMTLAIETVRIDPMLGPFPLAAGHSFPFTVPGPGSAPSSSPDVTLGLLGRHAFVGTVASTDAVTCVAPTAHGALLGTLAELVPFLAHGADGRPTLAPAIPLPASRVGATFVPFDGGLMAIGGSAPGATLFAADGTIAAEVLPGDVRAMRGAAVAPLGEAALVVIGGVGIDGALLTDVVVLERTADGVGVVPLEPLLSARTQAQAVALDAAGPEGLVRRVLVVDGMTSLGPADDYLVLDPAGRVPAVAWPPPAVTREVGLVPIATGQVLLAGGRDATGTAQSSLRVLFVGADRVIGFLSPPPDRLFRERAGPTAIAFAPGVVLVAGGVDALGAPTDTTELADMRVLPGSVRFTGNLPTPAGTTRAAVLLDGSVLVAAGTSLTLYFPFPT